MGAMSKIKNTQTNTKRQVMKKEKGDRYVKACKCMWHALCNSLLDARYKYSGSKNLFK